MGGILLPKPSSRGAQRATWGSRIKVENGEAKVFLITGWPRRAYALLAMTGASEPYNKANIISTTTNYFIVTFV